MADTVVVQTSLGPVKGIKKTSIMGDEYISFQKIPYIKPPIGPLRFKDPQPIDPWSEVLDATKQGPCGPANNVFLNTIVGEEDCIHINVFTKHVNTKHLDPVMVYIHGGAFMRGSSGVEVYGPDFLIQKPIILISFNYRIGAFGFLSLDDPLLEVPGNAGLKDQCMALKWVKENATVFGGDPNNITLFGESAGGCSVHYHMISEMSQGLFHKAIIQSGCALNNWAVVPRNDWARRLAKNAGWNGIGGEDVALNYLREVDARKIVDAQEVLISPEEHRDNINFPFGPVIEPYKSEQCLIPTVPKEMCKNAWSQSIPILIGGTADEGLFSYNEAAKNPEILENINNCEYMVPIELALDRKNSVSKKFGIALKNYYFGDEKPTLETYCKLKTDKLFWHGLHRTIISRMSKPERGPTYLYRFAFDSPTWNHFRVILCGRSIRGVCHADDLSYLFSNAFGTGFPSEDSNEYKTIQRMVSLWTSFATKSDPNGDFLKPLVWEPLTTNQPPFKCLNISDELSFIELPETERMALWDTMYQNDEL